ncbi:MAG: RNase P subunit p30 family protein [Vulcanisaeta sp.]|jgi:ribonuclease P/MRP protein subunit RPP1|nr:RNase P subunit p30 family protein [Vulcanisaeta sp.]
MFVELHLSSADKPLIRLLRRLGYGLAALTIGGGEDVDEIPIFKKLVITQNSAWKLRMYRSFDIVSVIPWNRFVLNKFISDDRIDVITINEVNINVIPSKPQARFMAKEGKALEIVLNPILKHGERGLAFLRDVINEYITVDGLTMVLSQGISNVADIRNPRDIIALISVLTGINADPLISDNPYELIVDAVYRRGVCT